MLSQSATAGDKGIWFDTCLYTQTHTQNIRTHTVISMCNFSHSTVPCLSYRMYLIQSSTRQCTWGLWVCACVMYPRSGYSGERSYLFLGVLSLYIRVMTVWLSMSLSFWIRFCLEFCTCNLSSSLPGWMSDCWHVFICSIFVHIFLLLYPWKLKMVSLTGFHYCMLSYKTHKARFPPYGGSYFSYVQA